MDLLPLKAHLKQTCGLSFDAGKEEVLAGAVQERMAAVNSRSTADYLLHVSNDLQEFQSLVNLLTINETYFFREPQHLELLTRRLLPRLLAGREPERRIRILCAGCSTGEEPYSLCIALLETFGANAAQLFAVTAADIDSEVLARAENAVYSGLSFRNMPEEITQRWFTACGPSRYRLHDAVRSMVSFRRLNLLEAVYPDELQGQDVILFRNVSIYFDSDVRQSVQAKLAGLLHQGGALIVGLTESLSNDFGLLSLQADQGVFYFVNTAPARPPARPEAPRRPPHTAQPGHRISRPTPRRPAAAATSAPAVAKPAPAAATASIEQALACLREKRYNQALAEIDRLALQAPADARCQVLRALIAFNRKDPAAAKLAAEQALALDQWNLDALLLLAQLARRDGDEEEAVRRLKQAIYAQPRCWPAHYWLAEIFRHAGQGEKAGREYRIVAAQAAESDAGNGGLLMFPLGVSPAEVAAMCRRQLQSLAQP